MDDLTVHLRYRNTLATGRFESDISYASVLDAHDNRPVLQHREVNPIAGLKIRCGTHFFGNRGLTLASYGRGGHFSEFRPYDR